VQTSDLLPKSSEAAGKSRTEKLQRNLYAYRALCLEVGLPAIRALASLGSSFTLLIVGDDSYSQQYRLVLNRFLEYQPGYGPILVILVRLDGPSKRSRSLGVCQVPQLRRYVRGREVRRLRGSAGYDELLQFFGGSVSKL
jgi:hypothetical protein